MVNQHLLCGAYTLGGGGGAALPFPESGGPFQLDPPLPPDGVGRCCVGGLVVVSPIFPAPKAPEICVLCIFPSVGESVGGCLPSWLRPLHPLGGRPNGACLGVGACCCIFLPPPPTPVAKKRVVIPIGKECSVVHVRTPRLNVAPWGWEP